MEISTDQIEISHGNYKKCPFCAEQIQKEAVFCRYCHKELTPADPAKKWYFKNAFIVLAILSAGPLALPLVWIHPRYNPLLKLVITVVTIVGTVLLCYAMAVIYRNLMDQIKNLGMM